MVYVKRVCITTDCWASSSQDSYMAVTAHFIDDDFEFESVLLECALLEGNHTSIALANALTRVTDEFGLIHKVSLVVSDNAANIPER